MLEIYGHPASQPSRSVLWLCALNDTPCVVHHDPAGFAAAENPRGQIPVLAEGGFVLSEMPAILAYLADRHGWSDWYPQNLETRARIQQYLHSHHTLTRLATLTLMAPHVLVAFESPPVGNPTSVLNNTTIQNAMADAHKLSTGQSILHAVLDVIERQYLQLPGHYIGGMAQPTIADLACYEEIAQLPWANLFDVSGYPHASAWLERMSALPHHEAMHRYNSTLGDIASTPNTMERMMSAIGAGLAGLGEAGFQLEPS